MTTALTITETGRLSDLERLIERARMSFVDAGEALREIREGRLYRTTHGTFEEYCRGRWNFTPQYGRMLTAAAEVVARMETIVSILPATESQARELTRLDDPDQQVAVWEKVVEWAGGDPRAITAKVVREEVQRFLPDEPDEAFIAAEEGATIRAWLAKRVEKWPEYLRPTFGTFVGGIVSDIASDLTEGASHAND